MTSLLHFQAWPCGAGVDAGGGAVLFSGSLEDVRAAVLLCGYPEGHSLLDKCSVLLCLGLPGAVLGNVCWYIGGHLFRDAGPRGHVTPTVHGLQ